MEIRSVTPMRIAKIGYIVMSVLSCIAGILFIVLPDLSQTLIGISIGIAMVVFGIIKLVGYFSKDLFRLAFQFDLEFGILLLIFGVILLLHPDHLMTFLCVGLGVVILLDGLFKIRIAMESRKFGIRDWGLILAMAIATGVIGAALILNSAKGAGFLTVLLGISLLAEGLLNLYTVISTVLIIKHQQPDGAETVYYTTFRKDR